MLSDAAAKKVVDLQNALHHTPEFSPFPSLPDSAQLIARSKSQSNDTAPSISTPSADAPSDSKSSSSPSRPRQASLYVSDDSEEESQPSSSSSVAAASLSVPASSAVGAAIDAIRQAPSVMVNASSAKMDEEKKRLALQRAQEHREVQIGRHATLLKDSRDADDVHWRLQQEKLSVMVQRMYNSRKTCEEIEKHLKATNKLLTRAVDQVNGVSTTNNGESGTLKQALIAQDILRSSFTRYLGEMRDRVFTNSARQASALAKNLSKEFSTLESRSNKLFKTIKARRAKTREAWVVYEKALEGRTEAENAEQPVKEDPFLACRSYEREVLALETIREEYHKKMHQVFQQFQEVDRSRVNATKAILLDNLLAQRAVLDDVAKFTDTAIDAVKQIDATADVNSYAWEAGLLMRDSSRPGDEDAIGVKTVNAMGSSGEVKAYMDKSAKRTVFAIPSPGQSFARQEAIKRLYRLEIDHEGVLYKQGRIFKSSWSKMYGCLSKSGFLHLFAKEEASSTESTIAVVGAKLGKSTDLDSNANPLAFYIETQDSGLFSFGGSTTVHFKAESEETLKEWMTRLAACV